jgi:Rha family phage regulatory protein
MCDSHLWRGFFIKFVDMTVTQNRPAPSQNEQLKGLVKPFHGHPVTTSRKVAEVFQKRHDNVLRDIQELIETLGSFNLLNFGEVDLLKIEEIKPSDFLLKNFFRVSYTDKKGRAYTEYKITKDAFTLLAMGYTGAKAIAFKIAYISRFNQMEAELQARQERAVLQAKDFVQLMDKNADFGAIVASVPTLTDEWGRTCYHYLLSLEKLGFSTRSGQVWKRVRRNPHYFVRQHNADYVAHDFLYNMFIGRIKAHNDKVFSQPMQPQLPFNQNQGGAQ